MMSPAAPMTISLEEHVARAIHTADTNGAEGAWEYLDPTVWAIYAPLARAAIAAVREREGDPAEVKGK